MTSSKINPSNMVELVSWFQRNYPKLVKYMKNSTHHYSDFHLNPYHIEGDVWTHTMMVCNQLTDSKDHIVNIAALLHDIGKPFCRESFPDKKKVGFYSHEPMSAFLALEVLDRLKLDFKDKVEVFSLIAMHTEIFKLSEEKINERLRSQPEFASRLKKLSDADKKGRFFEGENGEEYKPDVHLESYKQKDKTVTIMIGLPCSGKSTYAKSIGTTYIYVSRDEILKNLYPAETYEESFQKADQAAVNKELQKMFKSARDRGSDVVVDMTHMSRKSRRRSLSQFPKNMYTRKAVVFIPNLPELFKRNEKRANKTIGEEVYERMIKSFYLPLYDEFDIIEWKE